MKKFLTLCFVLCLLGSCQQEEFESKNKSTSQDLQLLNRDFSSYQNKLDPSILNSDWWKELHPASQQFISMELYNSENPITLKELQARKEVSLESSQSRKKGCDGFPANPEGDVTLNSQADVIAFGAMKCKEIVGALMIIDTLGPDPICDLQPLKKLKTIGSSLTINSDCLTSLNGLGKLKSIGMLGPFGFIGLNGDNIVDIEALSQLSTITGSLNLINCDGLTGFTSAFSNITAVQSGQTSAPITSIYVLNVNDNDLLTDLSGFSNIANIEGGLRILTNSALLDLDDLSGLNTIGDDIFILENSSLQNINELSNITSISDDLFVFDNPALTQCCGLYSLLCSDAPTCSTTGVGDNVAIFGNGAGCTDLDIIANGPCI